MRRPPNARRRKRLLLAALLILGILLTDYMAYPYGRWDSGRSGNHGENGLWLRYSWYFGRHKSADVIALGQRLNSAQVRYAFFHVRDIKPDGALRYREPLAAKRLTTTLHHAAPGVKLLAWIYAGNVQGLGQVDLSSARVRRTMVQQAVWLVRDCGFDGVQWDYEICPNGDAGFLSLLRETRAEIGQGKILSVAAALWLPHPLERWGWSDDFYRKVAAQCDQIAVMCYDSACYGPRGYAELVHQQVVHVTQDAVQSNPRCRVLIGVPTYGKGGLSHDPHTENMATALLGVRAGVADPRSDLTVFAGVAPFADYTTQPEEWQTYGRMWLTQP